MSKDISSGSDDVVLALQEQVKSQQEKITTFADDVDRYKRQLKEKENVLVTREKVDNLLRSLSLTWIVFNTDIL